MTSNDKSRRIFLYQAASTLASRIDGFATGEAQKILRTAMTNFPFAS
jgi:F0F1-type ATP synthase assembly protein I